ncbi:hypothetical protein L1987_11137 [Smallanthus sonchifolius]|uniref:Uncharacterized protein n=1 Tax=Smallanthus sonchifolius TaxID=185202 RepID=A0ACB9JDJ3_9ASTR|nr:hypothetical protein L1987_11137 [Smallanthus sonchifolius]
MSSSATRTTENFRHLYRLTNRILDFHSLHFIPISFLFLPFTFSASAAVRFYFSSSPGTDLTTMFDPFNLFLIKTIIASSQNLLTVKTLITALTFSSFVILPTVAGVALITYSTNQVIHCKPLTFSSTVKSLSHSYIPLLYTLLAGSIKLISLFIVFTLLPVAVAEAIKSLGFRFGLFSFSIFINLIVSYALAFTILFFIVIWGSAAAITVLESKSGFEALRESANQSTEFRRHSFSIVYFTGFVVGTALSCSSFSQTFERTANWILILQVGTIYLQSSLVILLYVVANTVLYVQNKVASGEKIAKTTVEGELSGEDVRLVVNDEDGEVFHEPAANGAFNYMLYFTTIIWVILLCVQFYILSI